MQKLARLSKLIRAFHAINRIRNEVAHSDFKIALRSNEVKEHVDVLREWLRKVEAGPIYGAIDGLPAWKRDLSLVGETVKTPPSARHVFLGAAIVLYVMFHHIRWTIGRDEHAEHGEYCPPDIPLANQNTNPHSHVRGQR